MIEITPRDAARARGNTKRRYVTAMFDRIAPRYDAMNIVISLGQTSIWRRRALKGISLPHRAVILDVGCGTGSVIRLLKRRFRSARYLGIDLSSRMLEKASLREPESDFCVGDAGSIPCRTESCDLVTTFFTTRNFADLPAAVCEMMRVLKPGGRLVVLDSFPASGSPLWRVLKKGWMYVAVPFLVRPFTDAQAYRYLAESIEAHCSAEALVDLLTSCGAESPSIRFLSFGAAAVISASKSTEAGQGRPSSEQDK
ncbi:MAG TPA: ubiquinone/menaquinone biosynthesis methyltransferase [Candidatus Latescibacteria bacterium]|nr:ubiquinone/menaquinone biosynthesis methyltransferase [Candidatus Latescibacterota bacterium]